MYIGLSTITYGVDALLDYLAITCLIQVKSGIKDSCLNNWMVLQRKIINWRTAEDMKVIYQRHSYIGGANMLWLYKSQQCITNMYYKILIMHNQENAISIFNPTILAILLSHISVSISMRRTHWLWISLIYCISVMFFLLLRLLYRPQRYP